LRIALGSDERSHLTNLLERELRDRGFQLEVFGIAGGDSLAWPDVALQVAERVASGGAEGGILCCWTGTGVTMVANKVPGIRAALCGDAETARGARAWNEANVLCLSLRATSETVAKEILDAWFSASPDPAEVENVNKVRAMDERGGAIEPALAKGEKGRPSG
jgi:ribose 5-phosphate isomerase B